MIPLLLLKLRTSRTAQIIVLAVLVALVGLGLYAWAVSSQKTVVREATEAGRVAEQRDSLSVTLNRVEEANDVRTEVSNTASSARYDECVQSARNPAQCFRFLSK